MANSNYQTAMEVADYDPYDRSDRFLKANAFATLALVDAINGKAQPVETAGGTLSTVYAVSRVTSGVAVTMEVHSNRASAMERKENLEAASKMHKLGLDYVVVPFNLK